mgnify:CR=1 FL=1
MAFYSKNAPLIAAFLIAAGLGAAFPFVVSSGKSIRPHSAQGSGTEFQATRPADLPKIHPVPAFKLTASDGTSFSPANLEGKVWIANFFFTSCKGPCPRMTEQLLRIYRGHRDRTDFAAVSITVDPETDTVQRLAEFARQMNADASIWKFLTGPKEQIVALSNEGFFLGADTNLQHSPVFVLIDRSGKIRGYYQSSDPEKMARLEHDLNLLLAE